MDGLDLGIRRKRSLKERIGLNRMGCCAGPIWGFGPTTMPVLEVDDGQQELAVEEGAAHHQQPGAQEEEELPAASEDQSRSQPNGSPVCGSSENRSESSAGMNLAAALAAERQYRALQEPTEEGEVVGTGTGTGTGRGTTVPGTPARVSLMRLLEEADGGGDDGEEKGESMCCVCMGRKKGAAFIPCGHTYCRVCSRELWLNRGSCPLCNRAILEILDIF